MYSVSWWGGLGIQFFQWDENADPDLDLGVCYKHSILTGPSLGYSVSRHGGSLDVLGAATDLCLKTFYCLATISCFKLFQLISCDFFVGSTLQVQYDVSCFL